MSNTPFGVLPLTGVVSSSLRDTVLPDVSGRLNSGARCPTWGAPFEAGSQRPTTKIVKTNIANTATLKAPTMELTIFERVGCGRSEANPRLSPMKSNTPAVKKITRLAHGKSRVEGNQTKIKK